MEKSSMIIKSKDNQVLGSSDDEINSASKVEFLLDNNIEKVHTEILPQTKDVTFTCGDTGENGIIRSFDGVNS